MNQIGRSGQWRVVLEYCVTQDAYDVFCVSTEGQRRGFVTVGADGMLTVTTYETDGMTATPAVKPMFRLGAGRIAADFFQAFADAVRHAGMEPDRTREMAVKLEAAERVQSQAQAGFERAMGILEKRILQDELKVEVHHDGAKS